MKEAFEKYLIAKGYKTETPTGNRSTVYDYIYRIDKVCEREHLSWKELADNISSILPEYDGGGIKEHLGKQSHSSVINALKRFAEFLEIL